MLHHIKPFFYKRFKTSFSKSGEDIQLWQLLKKSKGTYVDIGGHHPIFGNNSFFFYIRGWSGIVVEPNMIFKDLYQKFRPNDILITEGIADFDGELEYFEFGSSLLNSFSKEHVKKSDLLSSVTNIKRIPVNKISTIIERCGFNDTSIDFLSIDVEGFELNALKGNDWSTCRPTYILLESHTILTEDLTSEISAFLSKKNYSLLGKSLLYSHVGTLWYKSNESPF